MSKKSYFSLIVTVLLFAFLSLAAQPSESVARLRYKILNYKNPSNFKYRYALTRFSADDQMLAVAGEHNSILVYETSTGKLLQTIKYGIGRAMAFSFGADGKSLLTQDQLSYEIEVWDLETGRRRLKIAGRSVVSGLKKALITNVEQKKRTQEMRELPVSPDGQSILIAKTDSRYEIVGLADGTTRFSLEQSSKTSDTKDLLKILFVPGASASRRFFHVSNAVYNQPGTRIALVNGDRSPTLWDAETGKLIAVLNPQDADVYQMSFSSDGKLVATTDVDDVTKIWDALTGANLSTIGTKKKGETALAWSPQNETLATYTSSEKGRFYDARSGKLLTGMGESQIDGLKFNPDGILAATFAKNDKSRLGQIINVADGRLIADLPRLKDDEHPLAIEWSADGKLLVVSSVEYVKIFNQRGQLLQTLENAVFPARFSHNSRLLLTGGKNDDGFVWQIDEN